MSTVAVLFIYLPWLTIDNIPMPKDALLSRPITKAWFIFSHAVSSRLLINDV